jgi:hypothetical protein
MLNPGHVHPCISPERSGRFHGNLAKFGQRLGSTQFYLNGQSIDQYENTWDC